MKTLVSPIESVPWRKDYVPSELYHDAHVRAWVKFCCSLHAAPLDEDTDYLLDHFPY